uniref:LAM_G_DOMAIN domain-containing protein n=1 Tax=Macrostomum lignano TaxID=282301 RepID=A0A1I8FK94_9PLAT
PFCHGPAATTWYGDTWAPSVEAFGSSASSFCPTSGSELALATHSPDSALLRRAPPPAAATGLIAAAAQSPRRLRCHSNHAEPRPRRKLANVHRPELSRSNRRLGGPASDSVLLEMKNRKLRLSLQAALHRHHRRPGLQRHESLDIRFFGKLSRGRQLQPGQPLLSQAASIGVAIGVAGDSPAAWSCRWGAGQQPEQLGRRVEGPPSSRLRRLEGVIMKAADSQEPDRFFFHNRHPVPRPRVPSNNGQGGADSYSQFIGMSESKFYNLSSSGSARAKPAAAAGGFQGCVKGPGGLANTSPPTPGSFTFARWLRVVARRLGGAVSNSCGSADATAMLEAPAPAADVGVLDGCGRGRLPARRNFAGAASGSASGQPAASACCLNFDNLMDNLILFLHGGPACRVQRYPEVLLSQRPRLSATARAPAGGSAARWRHQRRQPDDELQNCSITSSFYRLIPNYFRVTLGRPDRSPNVLRLAIRDVAFLNKPARQIKQKASLQADAEAALSTGTVLGLLDSTSDVQRALTVHLRDGDIVISVQEDGNVLNEVRAAMPSSFLLCDGDWHTVVAEVDFAGAGVGGRPAVGDRPAAARSEGLRLIPARAPFPWRPANQRRLNYLPGNYVGLPEVAQHSTGQALPLGQLPHQQPRAAVLRAAVS